MPTATKHALLSASSAHRWLECTAAPHFEENFPDERSSYAEEGTLAHSICELYARRKFQELPTRKFNAELKKLQAAPLYQEEMLRTAEDYVEYLAAKAAAYPAPPHVAMEVKVDLTDYIPEGFGTCDCIMIGGDTLHITDYKHGKGVMVSAAGNPQMRLYTLGALKLYQPIYGDLIRKISMGICQPRLSDTASEDLMTTEELLAWGEKIKPIAKAAFDGPGQFRPGEHCRFCRGRAQCRARSDYYKSFEVFKNRTPKPGEPWRSENGPRLTDDEIGQLLAAAEGLAAWYKDLQEYAQTTLLSGGRIPGYKLVEGRSVRAFTSTDDAMKALTDAGWDEALLYDRKPKTLTELEKLLGKKAFAETLSDYITKPKGKPTLVPESDKREAYNPGAAEFEGVGNG